MIRPLLLIGFIALTCLSASCQVTGPMCTDLRESVESRETSLSRACDVDEQCVILETLPGRYVAVAEVPTDPEFDAAIAAFATECGAPAESEQLPNVFDAQCRLFQGVDSGTFRTLCAVTLDGQVVDPNDPNFELPPDALCDCGDDDDCGTGEICVAGCQCADPCESACQNVDSCGDDALLSLGLGSDLETCIAVCQANLADENLRETVLPCIAQSTCDGVETCLEGL